jgi:hypothetical protein
MSRGLDRLFISRIDVQMSYSSIFIVFKIRAALRAAIGLLGLREGCGDAHDAESNLDERSRPPMPAMHVTHMTMRWLPLEIVWSFYYILSCRDGALATSNGSDLARKRNRQTTDRASSLRLRPCFLAQLLVSALIFNLQWCTKKERKRRRAVLKRTYTYPAFPAGVVSK